MVKFILMVLMACTTIVSVFAGDILPKIRNYVLTRIPGNAELISVFPNTAETERRITQFSQGEHNLLVTNLTVGPSYRPIPSSVINMVRITEGSTALGHAAEFFIRAEAYANNVSEGDISAVIAEVSSTILFSNILSNFREELRLSFSYLTAEGNTRHAVVLWVSADPTPLEAEINRAIARVSSDNSSGRNDRSQIASNDRPTEQRRAVHQVNVNSDELTNRVRAQLESNDIIARFREENRMILGLDD